MREYFVYKPIIKLDMLGNKHKLINRLNSVAIIIILAVGAIGLVLNYVLRMWRQAGGMYFVYSLVGAALCVVYIYLHELTHAFAIVAIKHRKPEIKFGKLVASCGCPSITFSKTQYVFVASFPFLFYCALLIPLCVLLPPLYFPMPFLPLCYNVFGSMGDMYMIRVMLRAPKESIIIDQGTEVGAFTPIKQ